MTMEINFTNRETYLAWRANWREIYKEQAEDIRNTKQLITKAYAENNQARASSLQSTLASERKIARRLMETLQEAKQIAKEARQSDQQKQAA